MTSEKKFIIFLDGASKGNPGHSGVGGIVFVEGKIFTILSKYIGTTTNNIAEYTALKEILMKIEPMIKKKKEVEILIRCDSELLVKQLTGAYRIKNIELRQLAIIVMKMLQRYGQWRLEHIPREENRIADTLATSAINNALIALKSKH